MNILLTGAAGFIGWKTAEHFLNEGHFVVGIDNLNNYYDPKLKQYRLNKLQRFNNFSFREADVEDFKTLEQIFKEYQFDAVVNLAARAGVRASIEDPFIYMSTNAMGNLNLLELSRRYNVEKFVLASTSSIYAGQPMPFKEDLPVNQPISPYAATKKSAEVTCYTYHYLYGLDVTVVRYFTVYGPAGRPDMSCFRFIRSILEDEPITVYGDGQQSRDFTYVDDIARGTVLATYTKTRYEIINLGNNTPHKLSEMISIIEELLGKEAKIINKPFHKADMLHTWADIEKAKRLLHWEPRVSFYDGLKRTVDWFLENLDFVKSLEKWRDG
ncbi:NAD-dependent epimerase/dehydratase [Thermosulfidibacter takaii ABI70S6]|uniref:NAD-dependent epimerase/dehydratase n=1 Tax=Thermosulfidibacter takaii (strain DSM 17441 / JCM 13301 / NBRC 103674 / ABI70S6) TaxID=1298851 RepID=A0A0S3QVH3_THET7|nr:NAD-dependent epimerase/dehydratase family protein [Thermosulfidibacter takaii]BAT72329.1 NAD-dependent epimerase/dehydratase [Thermosulfidibacter takaii ABI70S6]